MKFTALGSVVLLFAGCAALLGSSNGIPAAGVNEVSISAAATPATPVKTLNELTFTDGEWDGKEVVKTEAEWKELLTPDEFAVLRQEATERPFSGPLNKNHAKGTYYCAACGLTLFKSTAKFESGTGWPSFYEPIYKKNVVEKTDNKLSDERVEIECTRCHSHIGHVFDDGPQPTGLRYCMNSLALKFRPAK